MLRSLSWVLRGHCRDEGAGVQHYRLGDLGCRGHDRSFGECKAPSFELIAWREFQEHGFGSPKPYTLNPKTLKP